MQLLENLWKKLENVETSTLKQPMQDEFIWCQNQTSYSKNISREIISNRNEKNMYTHQ